MRRPVLLFLVIVLIIPALVFAADKKSAKKKKDYIPDAPKGENATREEVAAYVKDQAFFLYFDLMTFKGDPHFILFRFTQDNPYYDWMKTAEALRDYADKAVEHFGIDDPYEEDEGVFVAPERLVDLGERYESKIGMETDETLEIKNELGKTFDRTKYHHE